MRKVKTLRQLGIVVILVSLVGLYGCPPKVINTTLPPPDPARLEIARIQGSLDAAFGMGEVYITAHPEKKAEWKSNVVPLFDMVNRVLNELIQKGKQGRVITVADVQAATATKITEITTILTKWGVLK